MQWRVNIPPLTRVLLALLVAFSVSYQALRYGVDYTAGHYLALIPQWALFTPWVYFTATYSEQNILTVLIAGATILYGGKYLERAWGSLEFGKFVLLVTLLPNFLASLIYVFLFAISQNVDLALVVIQGSVALQGAFLVAFKQLVPEHTVTIFQGALKIRVKHFPSIFLAANTLSGILLGTDTALVLAWVGFMTSWTYLRFYKKQPDLSTAGTGNNQLRGDASETFAFSYFWPDAMQPPVAAIADGIYNALVAIRVCTPFSAEDVEIGNEQATARGEGGLPNLLNHGGSRNGRNKQEEAERRRALALKALDQRLHAASVNNKPQSTATEPSVPNGNVDSGPSTIDGVDRSQS
ncbi:MAG: hypothetical protein LQ343_003454 [Gyalolechia ehrenbergii]|nr:MAG: hypothetical protein LQ343_003454 [Gyalolechia ehrenbergii]